MIDKRSAVTAIRNLNRRDCPLDRSLASVDLSHYEVSATGGRNGFVPATGTGDWRAKGEDRAVVTIAHGGDP